MRGASPRRPLLAASFLAAAVALASPSGPARSAIAVDPARCRPLPPSAGRIVEVATASALQQAVLELTSGTTVLIADGTYALDATLHLTGGVTDVALRGASGNRDAVVLEGRGMRNSDHGAVPHGVLVGNAARVLIADLSIRDVYYHAVQIQGERGAREVRLVNVRLVDAGEQLVKASTGGPPGPYADDCEVACSRLEYTDRARDDYTNGVDVLGGAGWRVRDNVFARIRAPVGQLAGPAVLFWRNSIGTVVERNLFLDCDRAIALGLAAPDPGMARDGEATYDHQGGVIRNNMVYRSAGAPTGDVGITVNHARDFRILHNTVLLQGTFPWGAIEYRFASTDGTIRNNLTDAPIWQRDGARANVAGNLVDASVDLFVDPARGDLHLRPDAAPAIDRVPALDDVPDDYDGEPRPAGAGADAGADEVGQPAATAAPSGTFSVTASATAPAGASATITNAGVTATARTDATATEARPAIATGRAWLPLVLAATGARPTAIPAQPTVLPHPSETGAAIPTPRDTATPVPSATPSATHGAAPSTTVEATDEPSPTTEADRDRCGRVSTFADGALPVRELHVAVTGSDALGDGGPDRPYGSIARAAREARPGTAIRVHAGRYAGGQYVEGLRGTRDAPVWLGGAPGEPVPMLAGGGEGLHLVRPAWLVIHDLDVESASGNGINADDGGDTADAGAAHHLVFTRLSVHDIGGDGNQDCLKLSGVRDVVVVDSSFARCGGSGSGSGIDMVGVHRAVVARSSFREHSGNAVQAKGGSADVEIRWNRMIEAGERAVNLGGSTGPAWFRPPLDRGAANAEARDIRVLANVIVGGVTPLAFVGCVDCLAAHNTIVDPRRWSVRILQETTSRDGYEFEPSRSGRVLNNVFVFSRSQIASDVNVGPNTAPGTFSFANNLWFARDAPARSRPSLPVTETGAVIGLDPLLDGELAPLPGSPAIGAGIALSEVPGDLVGTCYLDPPSIGAREARAVP